MNKSKDVIINAIRDTLELLAQIQSKLVLQSSDLQEKQKILEKYGVELQKSTSDTVDDAHFIAIETEAFQATLLHLRNVVTQYELGIMVPDTQATHDFTLISALWNSIANRIIQPDIEPVVTVPPQETADDKPIKVKRKKGMPVIAEIEDSPTYSPARIGVSKLLEFQFQLLYGDNKSQRSLTFLKEQEKHKNLTENIPFDEKKIQQIAKKTDETKKWISQYKTCTEKANKLIKTIETNYVALRRVELKNTTPANPKKIQGLWQAMEKDIRQLSELNQQRTQLAEQLNQFQTAYHSEENTPEALQSIEKEAYSKLKVDLKIFLQKIITIQSNKKDKEMQLLTTQVVDFITSITTNLKKVADKDAVNQLQTELNHYFQIRAPWENPLAKIKASNLTLDYIDRLMDDLIELPLDVEAGEAASETIVASQKPLKKPLTSKDIDKLKQNIATIRQMSDQLSNYDIYTTIKLFQTKNILDDAQQNLIAREEHFTEACNECHAKIAHLTNLLEDNRYLISSEFKKSGPVLLKCSLNADKNNSKIQQKIITMIQQIDALKTTLTELEQMKKRPAITYSGPIDSIEKLKDVEGKIKSQMDSQDALTAKLESIQHLLTEKEQSTATLLKETHDYLNTTNNNYQAKLSTKIVEIRTFMTSVGQSDNAEFNQMLDRAEKTLNIINDQTQAISRRSDVMERVTMLDSLSNTPESNALTRLAYINNSYLETMDLLDIPIIKLKEELKEKLDIEFQRTDNLLQELKTRDIYGIVLKEPKNSTEPKVIADLRDACLEDANDAQSKRNDMQNTINSIPKLDVSLLWETYQRFDQENESARNAIEDAHKKTTLIVLLKGRTKSPHYTATVEILNEMKGEFDRVFQKHLKKTKSLRDEQQDELNIQQRRNMQGVSLQFNDAQQAQLEAIDSRLPMLYNMYQDFSRINNDYINKDESRLSDSKYHSELQGAVNHHLRNASMEVISNGVNNRFLQWIRTLFSKLFNTKPNEKTNEASPTFGASITERAAIQWGNRFFKITAPETNPVEEVENQENISNSNRNSRPE